MIPQPETRPIPAKAMVRLLRDYTVICRGHHIVVPVAFPFDGASVPPQGWHATYTPWHPVVLGPACVHDWIYVSHQVSKAEADLIFHDLLIANGASAYRAWLMREAVEMFGGSAWEHSDEDVEKLRTLYRVIRRRTNFEEYHFPVHLIEESQP